MFFAVLRVVTMFFCCSLRQSAYVLKRYGALVMAYAVPVCGETTSLAV